MSTNAHPIGWFEIAGADTAKTEHFYGSLFNWSFSGDPNIPGYRMVDAGEGIAGGVTTTQAGLPDNYAIFSIAVPNVQQTCTAVAELGGKVLSGPDTIDGVGLTFANLQDPDGNLFGVFSPPAG